MIFPINYVVADVERVAEFMLEWIYHTSNSVKNDGI
jgi:hypothetical protein